MNAALITEDVKTHLEKSFGMRRQLGKGQVYTFGTSLTCSINYSRLLGGHKFFYAVPNDMLKPSHSFPATEYGEFALLICGAADRVLVLPRSLVLEMMKQVPTRRVDVFLEDAAYILQTTKHPKLNVTEYLNAYPKRKKPSDNQAGSAEKATPDRVHVRIQWTLIRLGQAEGCSVWVPVNDRNLSYQKCPFSEGTLGQLPNFGFEENTRRIVRNIDVLWLRKNVIQRAFEIESTTTIYSGLLRLNDLVLAQPNNRIDLYIAAKQSRRERVYDQLLRPSFQNLISACKFLSFETIEEQFRHLESFPVDSGARVSGLIHGERFQVPEHYVYPSGM